MSGQLRASKNQCPTSHVERCSRSAGLAHVFMLQRAPHHWIDDWCACEPMCACTCSDNTASWYNIAEGGGASVVFNAPLECSNNTVGRRGGCVYVQDAHVHFDPAGNASLRYVTACATDVDVVLSISASLAATAIGHGVAADNTQCL